MGQSLTRPKVIAVAIPLLLGQVVGVVQGKDSFDWFKTLKKPAWCPPAPAFPIVWTTLYALMGYASYLVYQHGGYEAQKGVLILYGVQLALNLLWPIIFFKAKKLKVAQFENFGLLAAAAVTAREFYKVDATAGKLFIPYIAWLLVANALNIWIARNNFSKDEDPKYEDLYHSEDKRNPGEQGYKPAQASLTTTASRARTVRDRRQLQVFGAMHKVKRHSVSQVQRSVGRLQARGMQMKAPSQISFACI